jgi:hypothetical protein
MSIILRLVTQDNRLRAVHEETCLADTAVTDLPGRAACLAQPYAHGPSSALALGGPALLARLDADPERLLYLDIPPRRPRRRHPLGERPRRPQDLPGPSCTACCGW